MNKLIQVNIGGLVFQIDEGAYHKLDQYLAAIRKKYAHEVGGNDILHDIESRIAELFSERTQGRGAIMQSDVDHIIHQMGQPDDFESAAGEGAQATSGARTTRRFFRDGDNRMLGGVCSGFGNYFDVDPLWIRLAFVAAFFFFGSGFLLYIVLWVIMPQAKTASEKLEMRGERINISNIEKTVRNGAKDMKERATEFGEEVKQVFSDDNVKRTTNSLGEFLESVVNMLKPVVRGIMKIFVFFISLACLVGLVAMSVLYFTDAGGMGQHIDFVKQHLFDSDRQGNILFGGAMALAAIPLFSLLVRGVKFLLNVKLSFKAFDWTMVILWVACLSAVITVGIQLAKDFEYDGRTSENVAVKQPVNGPLLVTLDEYDEQHIRSIMSHRYDYKHMRFSEDSIVFDNINLTIERSNDSLYSVTVIKTARGASKTIAKERADQITYTITQQDSVIAFPSIILLGPDELWREQKIDLILRVPQNKLIVLDKKLENYLRYNDYTDDLDDDEIFNQTLRMSTTGLQPIYF
jgi:phage shock protein C